MASGARWNSRIWDGGSSGWSRRNEQSQTRVRKLEGGNERLLLLIAEGCLTPEEKQEFGERHRREQGLPPEDLVVVIDRRDASVL